MITLKIFYSKHLKESFNNNKIFKLLKKRSHQFFFTKKYKKIAVLRSPHVFSKFKQNFASTHCTTQLKLNSDLYNIIQIHTFLQADLPISLKIKKKTN